jgi:hypothetical protein
MKNYYVKLFYNTCLINGLKVPDVIDHGILERSFAQVILRFTISRKSRVGFLGAKVSSAASVREIIKRLNFITHQNNYSGSRLV